MVLHIEPDDLAFDRHMNDYEAMVHSNLFYARDTYPAVVAGTPFLIHRQLTEGLPTRGVWSEQNYRNWEFDFDEMVVFAYDGGCLGTADPTARTQISRQPDLANLALMHNPAQITDSALEDLPPSIYEDIIGPEPRRGWCYHYQQIQWAMEQGQLDEAVRLGREAIQQRSVVQATNPAELVPLIVMFNEAGDYASARFLITLVAVGDAHSWQVLCERLQSQEIGDQAEIEEQMRLVPEC